MGFKGKGRHAGAEGAIELPQVLKDEKRRASNCRRALIFLAEVVF
jgi:hypothetical protein